MQILNSKFLASVVLPDHPGGGAGVYVHHVVLPREPVHGIQRVGTLRIEHVHTGGRSICRDGIHQLHQILIIFDVLRLETIFVQYGLTSPYTIGTNAVDAVGDTIIQIAKLHFTPAGRSLRFGSHGHVLFYKVPIKAFIAAVFHIVAEGQPVSAIHQVIVVAAEKQAQLGPKFTVGNEVKVNSSIDELLHAFIGFAEDFIKSRGLVARNNEIDLLVFGQVKITPRVALFLSHSKAAQAKQ